MFLQRFTTPDWLKNILHSPKSPDEVPASHFDELREKLRWLSDSAPEISIVIPAYNEEKNLLWLLASMAGLKSTRRVELLIANNKSTDRTQEILDRCGVRSILVTQQGVAHARQAGLLAAKGTCIVCADADSLYPPGWVDAVTEPLFTQPEVVCTYGYYSFIPSRQNSRLKLGLYESIGELFTHIRKRNREAVDVRGMNFAFRRADALAVGGFDVTIGHQSTFTGTELTSGQPRAEGRCEDGWLALCLSARGRLLRVRSDAARGWTNDRSIMAEGSLSAAFFTRVQKELKRLPLYLDPRKKITA
ncbi:glycosyltransferase family 2 protein [Tellurirhabdus rosea]|uniref:glycosyltransferase family 2 protein n=1 Tax=Tellurirhabdus rosea TaxID=2674997 RepID=UPI002259C3DE|nr:glycosyltransferase family A protein [Tellurirhabdus rosea]